MTISEQDVMEDLAYAEAEGSAEMTDMMEGEFYEDEDSADFSEDYFSEDGADFGEDAYESEDQTLGRVLGGALGAESEDEFFGKLFSGIKNIAKKAAPVLGKIGRAAAPILSAIPLPQAQLAGKLAGLVGKLRAEGGTVEDALEAVAEIAARDTRALPVVAGLAARSVIKNSGANMPPAKRQQVAATMNRAAKTSWRTAVNRRSAPCRRSPAASSEPPRPPARRRAFSRASSRAPRRKWRRIRACCVGSARLRPKARPPLPARWAAGRSAGPSRFLVPRPSRSTSADRTPASRPRTRHPPIRAEAYHGHASHHTWAG